MVYYLIHDLKEALPEGDHYFSDLPLKEHYLLLADESIISVLNIIFKFVLFRFDFVLFNIIFF